MRVLLVSSSSGSLGGGEQYLIQLGAGLVQLGHVVTTVMSQHSRMNDLEKACAAFGEVTRVEYCNTYDRTFRSGGAVLARPTIRRFAEFFQSSNTDIVHLNKQNIEDGLDLMLAAQRSGMPTVSTVHIARSMSALQSRAGFLRDWVTSRVLRRSSSHYITVAHHCAKQLQEASGGIDPNRVHAVWNGVSFAPHADRAAIRAEWGCKQGDVILGCVARLEQQKDPLFVLELLRRLPEHVKLVWVGDGRLREPFMQAVFQHNLGPRVILEGWRADARTRLAGFDVFVLPSEYEGFPFAVLEAMAAALPCVVSDVDGTREAVTHGETGYLCRPRDVEQWLANLQLALNSPERRQQLGKQGLERMTRDFSLRAMARATAEVYAKVLGQTEARSA